MVSAILGIVWEGFKGAVGWMIGYTKPAPTEARIMTDENKKKDTFNENLAAKTEGGLDEVRKRLPSN